MFDTAVFAQVPLELTGDSALPVQVNPAGDYRVASARPGDWARRRFRTGRPFHDGMSWKAMDLALHGMAAALATGADPL